jgi:hypothetical protein
MKKRYVLLIVLLLIVGYWIWSRRPSADKVKLFNSEWMSGPVDPDRRDQPNVIVLHFYPDSVTFSLPNGNGLDVAGLLRVKATGQPNHYTWDYSVEKNTIVLDPGFGGYSIPVEMSGDSLIWKGHVPVEIDHISFKRVR